MTMYGIKEIIAETDGARALPSNGAFRYAYKAGWEAAHEGVPRDRCPYCLHSGRSSQFAHAWERGYDEQRKFAADNATFTWS
jgi:hypothetical protein